MQYLPPPPQKLSPCTAYDDMDGPPGSFVVIDGPLEPNAYTPPQGVYMQPWIVNPWTAYILWTGFFACFSNIYITT